MKQSEGEAILAYLSAAFRTQLDPLSAQVYLEPLEECRREDGERAVRLIVRTSRFFPSIAELLDEIADVARQRWEDERAANPPERLQLPPTLSEEERQVFLAEMRKTRERLRALTEASTRLAPSLPDLPDVPLTKPLPIRVNEDEVARKREKAREAKKRAEEEAAEA